MNKIFLLMISVFLIGLISATVYQTPGADVEFSSCPECPECICPICDIQKDLAPGRIFAIAFAGIIFVVGLFFIIRREILMKKKKAKKEGEIPVMDKVQEEKLDELIEELGLDEVISKKGTSMRNNLGGIDKDEPKR